MGRLRQAINGSIYCLCRKGGVGRGDPTPVAGQKRLPEGSRGKYRAILLRFASMFDEFFVKQTYTSMLHLLFAEHLPLHHSSFTFPLNEFTLWLAPLRARIEDTRFLAERFDV
jgi:hypothetical protein